MEGIFDIHNHSLFGVDDGSKNYDMSKRMIGISYEEGVRNIILTPHYSPHRWGDNMNAVKEIYTEIKSCCEEIFPDLNIYLGGEILYNNDTLKELNEGKAPSMAEGRYVLAEFYPSVDYVTIRQAVMDLQQSGYFPIIAHIERYECFIMKTFLVEEIKELGGFIQVNVSSVLGEGNWKEKKFIKELIKYDYIHFIATDAHRDNIRTPKINECVERIKKKYGDAYAKRIFIDNPKAVIKNEYIEE